MPQLDFLTYQTQIFWLILCFFFLYFCNSLFILPHLFSILSIRQNFLSFVVNSSKYIKHPKFSTSVDFFLRTNMNLLSLKRTGVFYLQSFRFFLPFLHSTQSFSFLFSWVRLRFLTIAWLV